MAEKKISEKVEATEAIKEEVAKEKETNASKKCGKKKALIAVIACIVVAAVACACFFGYRMLNGKNPVKATTNAIRGLKDSINDAKKDSNGLTDLLSGDDAFEINTSIKVSLPKEAGLGNINLDALVQADTKNEAARVDAKVKAGSTEMLDLSSYFNKSKFYFKLADTMSNYYFMDISEALKEFKSEINGKIPEKAFKYDYTKLIDYLADAFDDEFSEKDFTKSKEKITVNDKEISTTKYSTKITQKKAAEIVEEFLEKVEKDDELISVIAELSGEDKKDIKKSIDELTDEITDNTSDDKNNAIDYAVYVTSLGKAVAYEFGFDEYKLLVTTKDDITTFSTKVQGLNVSLSIEKESDEHTIITADAAGMTATIDIKSSLETIKKNKEYKETLDIKATVSAMGQKLEASLNAVSTAKKIDEVEAVDTKSAIDVEKMTAEEAAQFQKDVERSSFYKFIEQFAKAYKVNTNTQTNIMMPEMPSDFTY
jgi:hypothetical protein